MARVTPSTWVYPACRYTAQKDTSEEAMNLLVGLVGESGSGKDTLAGLLVSQAGFRQLSFAAALYHEVADANGVAGGLLLHRQTKESDLAALRLGACRDPNFVRVALMILRRARPRWLRRGRLCRLADCRDLLAPRSPRWILQVWGTSYRRSRHFGHAAYWIDRVRAQLRGEHRACVISDVRLQAEANFVRERGGILVRLRRTKSAAEAVRNRALGQAVAHHRTATELLAIPVQIEVWNREGDPAGMLAQLRQSLADLAAAC